MKTNKAFATATGLTAALLCGAILAPAANAQTVVVSNQTPPAVVAADVQADMVGIELIPGGIVVTGHGGDTVHVSTKGQKTRTIKPKNASTPAKFSKLTPGKTYTISVGGTKVASTTVVRAPGQTYNMVVQTTDDPGSVLMTWDYVNRSKTGDIAFRLIATPVAGQANTDVVSVDVPGTAREGILTGLDPHTLYKFSVEAVNAAASGPAVDAVMTQSLATLTGADEKAQAAAQEAARQAAEQGAAQKAAQEAAARAAAARPTPAPAPAGGGGGPVRPATKTIWECPTGFEDNGGNCKTTSAYTYTIETQTSGYTYRTESVPHTITVPATHNGQVWTWSCPSGYDAGGGQWGVGVCKGSQNVQVKNAPPSGWYDNGSAYAKDTRVKDAAPDGYIDDGTAYVKYAEKVAREVPA